jgi:hypothetical protein
VVFSSPLQPGHTASVSVVAQAGILNAWLDFNDDGDWLDDGEHVFADVAMSEGINVLEFTVPSAAVVTDATIARFRLSTQAGLSFTGVAPDGEVEDHAFAINDISGVVVGRHVLYNFSAWDGRDSAANARDDGAIASDKTALLPGQIATFANYTSYSRGINGLIIDVRNLAGTPTVDDFLFRMGNDSYPYGKDLNNPADDWPWAPAPVSITVRAGAGLDGADRVTLIWTDGAISKRWLQVTMRATDVTGLAANDVFYVGNAVGEAGDSAGNAVVNATDEILARNNPHGPSTLALLVDRYDYNRDKLVNATDQIIARNNRTGPSTALRLINPPLEPAGGDRGEGEAGDGRLEAGPREAGDDRWVLLDDLDSAYRDRVDDSRALPYAASTTVAVASLDARGRALPWFPVTDRPVRSLRGMPTQSASEMARPQHLPNPPQVAPIRVSVTETGGQPSPLGRLNGVNQHVELVRRVRWAAERETADELDTLDLALAELIAEWEQF